MTNVSLCPSVTDSAGHITIALPTKRVKIGEQFKYDDNPSRWSTYPDEVFTAPLRAAEPQQLLELLRGLDVDTTPRLHPAYHRHQQRVGGGDGRDRGRRADRWRRLGQDVADQVRQNHLHQAGPVDGNK